MTHALVTGGAGFIGSNLVGALLARDWQVTCIDDFSAGKMRNVEGFQTNPNFRLVTCDISDFAALSPHFAGVDLVFHEAVSKNTVCMKDPRRDLMVNALGTMNVLEASVAHGVKKVIHASTGSVYGEAKYLPEDEAHPLDPVSYYGVSKLAAERYCFAFQRLHGLRVTALRYFHVYGPNQDSSDYGGVVPIFIRRVLNGEPPIIYGDGTQVRSFTYVQDVVNANLFVADRPETDGQVYNCASGLRITIGELAQLVLKKLNRGELEPVYKDWRKGDIKVFEVSNRKLCAHGFEFGFGFDEGVSRTIEWMQTVSSALKA